MWLEGPLFRTPAHGHRALKARERGRELDGPRQRCRCRGRPTAPSRRPVAMPGRSRRKTRGQKRRRPPRGNPGRPLRTAPTMETITRDRSGVAFLLVCARIERTRGGEHAATGLVETRETAKDRQRGRTPDGVLAVQAGDEPAIGRPAPRAMQPSLGREIRHAAARKRIGSRPLVFKGENHAERARPGPPVVPPWWRGLLSVDVPDRNAIQAIASDLVGRKVLNRKSDETPVGAGEESNEDLFELPNTPSIFVRSSASQLPSRSSGSRRWPAIGAGVPGLRFEVE